MMNAVHSPRSREDGVVLIFTLIVLLILTIGAVALVRSMQSSLFSAGNLAFRRDLVNQGELVSSNVLSAIKAGQFPSSAVSDTTSDLPSANYSSKMLATNQQGVPKALFDDTLFFAVASAPDLVGATSDVRIRYLIDRLCTASGPASSDMCVQSTAAPHSGPLAPVPPPPPPTATVYRVTVRVTGPRSTQVFLQSTFAKPD